MGGEKSFVEWWHCIVCLCEWCGWDNHKVLLGNYHVCQSTAIGCVGGRETTVCGCSVSSVCHGRATTNLKFCFVWAKHLWSTWRISPSHWSSVLSCHVADNASGQGCVPELPELWAPWRNLFFPGWVNPVPAYTSRSVLPQKASSIASQSPSLLLICWSWDYLYRTKKEPIDILVWKKPEQFTSWQ